MLHPFLFVGVGGSGGKTLRTLKADLVERLLEVGYDGDWPTCWQFLHIDVPTDADGNEVDLPSQLDEKDYVGLVGHGIDYRTVDNVLVKGGHADQAVLRNLLGWRPDAARMTVPIARGAGQYRAVGRAITLSSLATIETAIRRAMGALQGPRMTADLAAVSRAFDVPSTNNTPTPSLVVVSSLAGGSGSGAFLDVCDTIRAVGGTAWAHESFGVLYAPDVFNHLKPDERKGVHPNALAALCELMSGFWDPEPRASDFAIIEDRGINVGAPQRRGPRFPLIVGTRNAQVGFTHQNDVYRAIGKALAAWVASENLQNKIKAYATGNWSKSGEIDDATRLRRDNEEQPLSAIGFARVALGRDNFATYAAERLARGAVTRVLRQHLSDRPVNADPNHQVAIEERATGSLAAFIEGSRLDERGTDRNQIIDALRPVTRKDRLEAVAATVRSQLTGGRAQALPRRQWLAELLDLMREHERRFADDEAADRNERAREWAAGLEPHLLQHVSASIAADGAPVTEKLLDRLRTDLEGVLAELPEEESNLRHWTSRLDELVSGVLQPNNDAIFPDNPLIVQAINTGLDCFDYLAEADLYRFTMGLVRDVLHNVVQPLLAAVRTGRELLATMETGDSDGPSMVERWPVADLIPRRFQPAANEFLLEPVDDYTVMFRETLMKAATVNDPGGAEAEFVRHTIVGSKPTAVETQQLIYVHRSWVPSAPGLRADHGGTRGQYELKLHPEQLLSRARSLMYDRDTSIGMMVGESLQDYLDERAVEPAELSKRLDTFNDALVQALQTSSPLVNINPSVLARVHSVNSPEISYMFTEIPFPAGTPGYERVKSVLESRHQWDENAERAFTEGRQSRIDVFSMLASAYNPVVFESIVSPIAGEWAKRRTKADQRAGFWRLRRARPLATFVPCAPHVLQSFIRGWFTARLLGELQFDPDVREAIHIWDPSRQRMLSFPSPLLGQPVFEDWERLPAVLESLPLALLEYAVRAADEALAPYWRLRDLGVDARGADSDYQQSNRALEEWIRLGRTSPGAPSPNPELAGSSGITSADIADRKDWCTRSVANWRKRYGDLVELTLTVRNFASVSRAAEIGECLIEGLDDLERAIGRILTVDRPEDY